MTERKFTRFASKSKAVSYQRLLELEKRLQAEVEELLTLAQQTEEGSLPEGLVVETEIAWRPKRLLNLREAKAVLTQRAAERYQAARKAYEQKIQGRVAKRAVKRVENLEEDLQVFEPFSAAFLLAFAFSARIPFFPLDNVSLPVVLTLLLLPSD